MGNALEDRGVALVTGASRGIGQTVSERLTAIGYRVVTASRSAVDHDWPVEHIAADLSQPDDIDRLLDTPLLTETTLLMNNVGVISNFGGVGAEVRSAVLDTFSTNLFGPLECCRRLAPIIANNGGGSIINVSSIYGGVNPAPMVMSYAASKAALASVTTSLAVELGASNIRVNAVLPGNIDTDMTRGAGDEFIEGLMSKTPLGRLGTTSEIADAVEFRAGASFVTGHLLVVDGGLSLVGG